MASDGEVRYGLAGRLAKTFLRSKLTPLVVVASILLGAAAVALTPREEEPQIIVPMVDVLVPMPGSTPTEVESQLTSPLERRLWGIPGVEYLYSASRPGAALLTVRFKVNEPLEPSLSKVHQELAAHPELLPSGALQPIVRLLTIDDVPFLVLTLRGEGLPAGALRQLGEETARSIADVPRTAQVRVLGGARRQVRIEPDPERLRTLGVSLAELDPALRAAQAQLPAGALVDAGRRVGGAQGGARVEGRLVPIGPVPGDGPRVTETGGGRVSPKKEEAKLGLKQQFGLGKGAGSKTTQLPERVLEKGEKPGGAALAGLGHGGRSPATTARRPARSPTSSSSTSSSPRSRSSRSSPWPWAGGAAWWWASPCR